MIAPAEISFADLPARTANSAPAGFLSLANRIGVVEPRVRGGVIEVSLMTTTADYPGDRSLGSLGVHNDPSGSAPMFSMRTLMVTTADAVSDDAAAQPRSAGVTAAVAGVCSVCGTDRDRYSEWQQRRDQAREVFEQLSRREQEIAGLAAAGLSSRDCADRLRISAKTVEKHRLSAYRRLQVPGLAGLIRIFLEADLPVPPGAPFAEDGADDVV